MELLQGSLALTLVWSCLPNTFPERLPFMVTWEAAASAHSPYSRPGQNWGLYCPDRNRGRASGSSCGPWLSPACSALAPSGETWLDFLCRLLLLLASQEGDPEPVWLVCVGRGRVEGEGHACSSHWNKRLPYLLNWCQRSWEAKGCCSYLWKCLLKKVETGEQGTAHSPSQLLSEAKGPMEVIIKGCGLGRVLGWTAVLVISEGPLWALFSITGS